MRTVPLVSRGPRAPRDERDPRLASLSCAARLARVSRVACVALLLAAAGCATANGGADGPPPRFGDEWAAAPGARPVTDLGIRPDLADLALTIYPTPRRAEYGDVLLPLDGALRADESSDDVDRLLRASGLEIGFRELPPEGYAISVTWDAGRTVVVAAARDDPGRRWAASALAQVTTEIGGRAYVRACRVLDAPVFPLRGNKRPQAWEERYRANFAWEAKATPDHLSREQVATTAPGSPLDATPEGIARILEEWRPWQEKGVRRFCVKFDDVGFGMTPATNLRHGSYPVALRSLLSAVRSGLRERDPEAVLYLLPQTYWWNDRRMGPYARALRDAGGLDRDVGLVLTGPEIVSDTIDVAGLAATLELFGSVETPALVYDNLGREGDWGPLTGRDSALASMCDGVFGERGTPVNRLTRLDWLWNPAAYDPERSWRRAVLELAGAEGYDAFAAACDAFRRGAPREEAAAVVERFAAAPGGAHAGPLPRDRILRLLRDDLGRLTLGRRRREVAVIERVRIDRIASGGDGVGRLSDGRVVFVPRTAPGDLADVRIESRRAHFARGVVEVLCEPSPARFPPRCAHYEADDCGGCALQHLSYDAQLAAKAAFVDDAFRRIAKVPAPPATVVPNPRPFGWRSRLALSIDRRTGDAGLRRLHRPDAVFALRTCEIASDGVRRLWDALRARRDTDGAPIPPLCERLTLREDRGGGLHAVAHGVAAWGRAAETAARLADAGVAATLWVQPDGAPARIVAGPAPSFSPTVFEQVDPEMGDLIRDAALAMLGDIRGRRVWDLYAGIGETSARLAAAGASVESVEADPEAVDEAARRGPAGVRRHAARVEDVLDRLGPADAVIANPPRSGMGRPVTDGVAAAAPRRVVYVSCDPATLARDVARLGPGWRVEALRAFDSFPQTAHVETVVALAPRQASQP